MPNDVKSLENAKEKVVQSKEWLTDIIQNIFKDWFNLELTNSSADIIAQIFFFVVVLILAFLINFITKKFILVRITRLIKKTSFQWGEIFLENKVFNWLLRLLPAMVIYFFAPVFPSVAGWIQRITLTYMLIVGVIVLERSFSAGILIYNTFEISKERPIKGYVQIVKILLYTIIFVFILGILMNRSPWGFLTGLGALTAILILVFKDTILGLVASFQFVTNKMVQIGDWIAMPKYAADGSIIDITLNTVKVKNWDNTISTIPTYALVSDSFKNWRGMTESGGRRIKRALYIDMKSIQFCTEEMVKRFEQIHYITNYIQTKSKEIADHNKELNLTSKDISGRRLTNVGTFRAYVVAYLRDHPKIANNMDFLVRQLAPSDHGLPIEIYVFSNDIKWVNYEGIQSDIFDHLLAVLPEFDLRLFQNPSGYDFENVFKKNDL